VTSPPPPADQGGAWISSGQIYQELRRIGDEVVKLRLEMVQIPQLREALAEAKTELDALAAEVEALKDRRWPLQAVGVLAGVAATVISLVALLAG
jgi:hypothetical protein